MKIKFFALVLAFTSPFVPGRLAFAQTVATPATAFDFYRRGLESVTERPDDPYFAALVSYLLADNFLRKGDTGPALYFLGRAHAFFMML